MSVGGTFYQLKFGQYRGLRAGNPSIQPRRLSDSPEVRVRYQSKPVASHAQGYPQIRHAEPARKTLATGPDSPHRSSPRPGHGDSQYTCAQLRYSIHHRCWFSQGRSIGNQELARETRLTKVTTTIGITRWWLQGKGFDSLA